MMRLSLATLLAASTAAAETGRQLPDAQQAPTSMPTKIRAKKTAEVYSALVTFKASPFPYSGDVPEQPRPTPFLQSDDGESRPYHLSPRGGKLFADTYDDRRTLLHVPPHFDPRKPGAAILLFFHGNKALLTRDVIDRQRVPAQLDGSGRNFVLVAPQLAKDVLDSSAGHFWEPRFLDTYLAEAAGHLADRAHGVFSAADIDDLPVVIVAYSGGYLATAFSLKYQSRARARIGAVVLLDALFGEEPKFADWIGDTHDRTIFVSAYSAASRNLNARLIEALGDERITVTRAMPDKIGPGSVVFLSEPGAAHDDFVTVAGSRRNILRDILTRLELAP